MKKVERYFYPAIFTYENGEEISVVFPDLDCATSGINDDDALLSIANQCSRYAAPRRYSIPLQEL